MTKETITTTDLKSAAGEFVNAARLRGDCYIISQRGKEGAALVPIEVLNTWERSRKRAVEIMNTVAQANDLSADEAQQIGLEAVAKTRRKRRSKS